MDENILTDLQFKDKLRKELIFYKNLLEYAEKGDTEKVMQQIKAQINRINASLQG